MANIIVVGILVMAVGLAVSYIVKAKKSGKTCIGCPSSGCCGGGGDGSCGCGCHDEK